MKFTGAQLLIHALEREGVDTIFGYPGGTVIDIYDELQRSDLLHIRTCHEQGAIHAADGYARAGGRTGVCLVTSGPGATNTVTGIAAAYTDSIPLVILTGQVSTHLIGKDSFQEVDIVGITRPCTKHNYLITRTEDIPRIIREAFCIATTGRPGPVLVDIPKNLVSSSIDYDWDKPVRTRSFPTTGKPDETHLETVAKFIRKAHRPVIVAGEGILHSKSSTLLTDFARQFQIPVTSSLMGLGAFPGSDPLWLGMTGLQGMYRANIATGYCDLLIASGVNFANCGIGKTDLFASRANMIHIGYDPVSSKYGVPSTLPVSGDCHSALSRLHHIMNSSKPMKLRNNHQKWLDHIYKWKYTPPPPFGKQAGITPRQVIETLYEQTKGQALIATESDWHQLQVAQYYRFDIPGGFISTGGLNCMGFSLPAAIGAQAACPDRPVICVTESIGIQMTLKEIATAVQYRLPIKIIILNNRHSCSHWFGGHAHTDSGLQYSPDFMKLAEAYGACGLKADHAEDVGGVLEKGLAEPGPVIMDFSIEENIRELFPWNASRTYGPIDHKPHTSGAVMH